MESERKPPMGKKRSVERRPKTHRNQIKSSVTKAQFNQVVMISRNEGVTGKNIRTLSKDLSLLELD